MKIVPGELFSREVKDDLLATRNGFRFVPAEDGSVDDAYELVSNPNIQIQVAPYAGGFAVNGWNPAEFSMSHGGMWTTMSEAVKAALDMGTEAAT